MYDNILPKNLPGSINTAYGTKLAYPPKPGFPPVRPYISRTGTTLKLMTRVVIIRVLGSFFFFVSTNNIELSRNESGEEKNRLGSNIPGISFSVVPVLDVAALAETPFLVGPPGGNLQFSPSVALEFGGLRSGWEQGR